MSDATGLPAPWTVRVSKTHKREYYFNPETKESIWEPPAGTDLELLKTYSEAHPTQVQALHLLIKHNGSRRPASHRNPNITISKEEAIEELSTYQQRLAAGEKFEDLAMERSDCSSSKRGGDLGPFTRGMMQPSFENAAFNLKVGEVSGVVESDSGVHIIKRVA